jgi:UrcA family protein
MDSRINRFSSFVPQIMSLLILGAAVWVPQAGAGEKNADDAFIERVRYDDLNVTSESGRKELMTRLQSAANRVCEESSQRDVLQVQRACVKDTLSRALSQVDWTVGKDSFANQ